MRRMGECDGHAPGSRDISVGFSREERRRATQKNPLLGDPHLLLFHTRQVLGLRALSGLSAAMGLSLPMLVGLAVQYVVRNP